MTSISPNYYAGGSYKRDFILEGVNFSMVPSNAIGLIATDNNNPLELIEATSPAVILSVGQNTDTAMSLLNDSSHTLNEPSYLGAIVSNDRQVVYWVNQSRPLP